MVRARLQTSVMLSCRFYPDRFSLLHQRAISAMHTQGGPPGQIQILGVFATKFIKYSPQFQNELTHIIKYPPLSIRFMSIISSCGWSRAQKHTSPFWNSGKYFLVFLANTLSIRRVQTTMEPIFFDVHHITCPLTRKTTVLKKRGWDFANSHVRNPGWEMARYYFLY